MLVSSDCRANYSVNNDKMQTNWYPVARNANNNFVVDPRLVLLLFPYVLRHVGYPPALDYHCTH